MMAYHKIWVHIVWCTKYRTPYLKGSNLLRVIDHIKGSAVEKSYKLDRINGWDDHIHVLLCLHPSQSLASIVMNLKGESSFWAKNAGIHKEGPLWAKEYYAASVSEDRVPIVRRYVDNQQAHHHPDLQVGVKKKA